MLEIPVKLMNALSGQRKSMIVDYGQVTVTATSTTVNHKLGMPPVAVITTEVRNDADSAYQYPIIRGDELSASNFKLRVGSIPHVNLNVCKWLAIAFVDE
jgi:hypothetical protein